MPGHDGAEIKQKGLREIIAQPFVVGRRD